MTTHGETVVAKVQERTNMLIGRKFLWNARNSKFSIGGKKSRLFVCRQIQLMRKMRDEL